jgi:hypothetical protein
MKWLDRYETGVLEYIATVPFEVRKEVYPPKYHNDAQQDAALDRLQARGLIFPFHGDGKGWTYKITSVGALIRSAMKSGMRKESLP